MNSNMEAAALLMIALLFFGFSLVSQRIKSLPITAPMVFTAGGFCLYFFSREALGMSVSEGAVHFLAELTLVLVLFSDAASINVRKLLKDHLLPVRMLAIGLPFSILLGAGFAYVLFGTFTMWMSLLLASVLAPTDAALGQSVVSDKSVPERIRQAISVESGLNDGLALPLVLVFLAIAGMGTVGTSALEWLGFSLLQILLGPAVGLTLGYAGAKLVDAAVDRGLISKSFEGISALALSVLCFSTAELVFGNGFIAAFVGGLAFGHFIRHECNYLFEFAESEGQFFTLSTFFILGAIALPIIGEHFEWMYIVYGILSLTVIRMLPISVSLIRTGVGWPTKAFLGWFGPRGLASILFALLIVEEEKFAGSEEIVAIVLVTVLMSIALHGVSSAYLSRQYGEYVRAKGECAEMEKVRSAKIRAH